MKHVLCSFSFNCNDSNGERRESKERYCQKADTNQQNAFFALCAVRLEVVIFSFCFTLSFLSLSLSFLCARAKQIENGREEKRQNGLIAKGVVDVDSVVYIWCVRTRRREKKKKQEKKRAREEIEKGR